MVAFVSISIVRDREKRGGEEKGKGRGGERSYPYCVGLEGGLDPVADPPRQVAAFGAIFGLKIRRFRFKFLYVAKFYFKHFWQIL